MSRAYRIRVSESLSKIIRASDHVSTKLELLDILSCDEMAEILATELVSQGFERTDAGLVKQSGDVTVKVDAESGTVTVTYGHAMDVELSSTQQGYIYDETSKADREQTEDGLKKKAQNEMEDAAEVHQQELQKQVTDQLEAELVDVQRDLGKTVNRATAEALKRKASRIGQINELTEDPESGSLTIVLEV